ncbi:unnamed protein product, partial [marine sediment metagenome]
NKKNKKRYRKNKKIKNVGQASRLSIKLKI